MNLCVCALKKLRTQVRMHAHACAYVRCDLKRAGVKM